MLRSMHACCRGVFLSLAIHVWFRRGVSTAIKDAMHEEYKHFSMAFEFILRRRPEWRAIAKGVVFQDGDLVENAEAAEAGEPVEGDPAPAPSADGSLGIGSLRGAGR